MILFSHKYSARSWKEKVTNDLKKDNTEDQKRNIKIEGDTSKSLANVQSRERKDSSEEDKGNLAKIDKTHKSVKSSRLSGIIQSTF